MPTLKISDGQMSHVVKTKEEAECVIDRYFPEEKEHVHMIEFRKPVKRRINNKLLLATLAQHKKPVYNQCSFGFVVTGQEEDYSGETPLIRITNVDLWEVSIVSLPAYEDTEAALRSKFQEQNIEMLKLRKKILKRIGEFTL